MQERLSLVERAKLTTTWMALYDLFVKLHTQERAALLELEKVWELRNNLPKSAQKRLSQFLADYHDDPLWKDE